MRVAPLALAPLLLFGACVTPQPERQTPLPTETWEPLGAEAVEGGLSTAVSIDLSRTRHVEGQIVHTVGQFAFSPAQTDAETGTTYDRQEQEQEVDCVAGSVRILGYRSYLGDELVGEGGALMDGMAMGATGPARMVLERACQHAGRPIGR